MADILRQSSLPDPFRAAPSAGWKVLDASTLTEDRDIEADVAIVGTGAGGGTAAEILSGAGLEVVMIEEGPLATSSNFRMREADAYPQLYQESASRKTKDKAINILQGRCVGGGTTVNWTSSFRTPVATLEHWATSFGLAGFGADDLAPWFDRMERRLGIAPWPVAPNKNNDTLRRGAQALGISVSAIRRNVKGCWNIGYCGMGCPTNAKQSMLVTTIPAALERGATLLTRTRALKLEHVNGRVGALACVGLDARGTDPTLRRITVRAKTFIAAGGAIGTPALLLRSGLGGHEVGRSLHLHPVPPVPAVYDEPIRLWSGPPQTVMSDAYAWLDGAYGFRLEVPSALPGVLAASFPWRGAVEHSERMRELDHVAVIIPIVRDREAGRVMIDRAGRPIVRYRVRGMAARHCVRAIVEAAYIHLAAGAREAFTLHTRPLAVRRGDDLAAFAREVERRGIVPNRVAVFSAHQMSTARMGGRRDAVADPEGRVRGVRGLYVADASGFPSASGVNPMLTVMALARRNAVRILASG